MGVIISLSKGYKWSTDYERLFELMQRESIICEVQFKESRDIAHTICVIQSNESYSISSRGIGYITEFDKNGFIKECKALSVKFIDPYAGGDE